MSANYKRRTKFSASSGKHHGVYNSKLKTGSGDHSMNFVSSDKKEMKSKQQGSSEGGNLSCDASVSLWNIANILLGLTVMVILSGAHSWMMYQLHENNLWFTNIKEVEREISFRTESGLYYSYYKQLVQSKSLMQGLQDLQRDNLTEHPDTINVLERMNIYQEVCLAAIYKLFSVSLAPILFYIYAIFWLQSLLVSGIYMLSWVLSGSWLAGLLSATLYIFNRLDTTRVSHSGPLRENFSLPFIWLQAAALAIYFKPSSSVVLTRLSLVAASVCTFMFCLFWQFNQFIMMLQAFALFGVWLLGLVPAYKVRITMIVQLVSLLVVCILQFGNEMLIGSLAVSFLLVAIPIIYCLGDQTSKHSIAGLILKVINISFVSLGLMVLLNTALKVGANVDSDEHIFKFLQNKFGVGDERDFDARLYLCLSIFGFISWDVFERLTANWALPLYVPAHLVMFCWLVYTVFQNRRKVNSNTSSKSQTGKEEDSTTNHFFPRPELAYHVVQCVFFGALSMLTLRMKYFWTPYVCVLAAVGVTDTGTWTKVLGMFKYRNTFWINVSRCSTVILLLSVMTAQLLPPVLEELKVETEFWDPDTVELMEWISVNTKPTDSFTGSMQLLAGVKLCTGRPITNHPHYEDKYLRLKTKELYQIYGRRKPEDVHAILEKYSSRYIILEDSICRAPSRNGCRVPDLIDISNGVMPDEPLDMQGLKRSSVPRFCEALRHEEPNYSKYFKTVLVNKTFRVYKVL